MPQRNAVLCFTNADVVVDASGLTAYQMLPALGGFAMYKLGVAWQGTRLGLQAAGDDLGEVASQMERTSGA